MRLPRAAVVARRVLVQLRRDRRTLLLIIVQPIVIMAVFGYAFGGDVEGAKVAVANMDRGTLASKILDHFDPAVIDVRPVATGAQAEAALRRGDVSAAIVFPANFTRNFDSAATADPEVVLIVLYKDNTNPQVTGAVIEELGDALEDAIEDETDDAFGIVFDERVVFGGEEERSLDFFVPGIAAFAIFQLGALLTVITIVKERTIGTLPRIMASPVQRYEVVLGYTGAFTVLSLAQAVSILAIATLVFRVPIVGNVWVALLATGIVGVMALGFGILVSGIAQSEFQAVQTVFLVSFPMLFLAGVFAPVEAMPAPLRPVVRFIPLSYAVDALRDVINQGHGLEKVGLDLLVVSGFAVFFLAIATVTFARKA